MLPKNPFLYRDVGKQGNGLLLVASQHSLGCQMSLTLQVFRQALGDLLSAERDHSFKG